MTYRGLPSSKRSTSRRPLDSVYSYPLGSSSARQAGSSIPKSASLSSLLALSGQCDSSFTVSRNLRGPLPLRPSCSHSLLVLSHTSTSILYPVPTRKNRVENFLISPVPAANINLAQGVFIEMFITAALCLAVLMLAAEKHSSTPIAPVREKIPSAPCQDLYCPTSRLLNLDIDRHRPDTICLPFVSRPTYLADRRPGLPSSTGSRSYTPL